MRHIAPTPQRYGRVTALFEDGPHSFILAKDATLAVLSGRLAKLRRQNHGELLNITVRFDAKPGVKTTFQAQHNISLSSRPPTTSSMRCIDCNASYVTAE